VKHVRVEPVIRALAKVSLRERPLADILQEITDIARSALPGAEATSVTLVRGEDAFTAAHSGQMALDADELQYERGYGPCVDAGRTGLTLRVPDMREETRWPDYAAAVTDQGVLSSVSAPLPHQSATIGALNVYSAKPNAFGDAEVAVAEEVADYVAVAVANADAHTSAVRLAEQMRQAMESRAVIDMAKGVLIARHHCTPEEAFAILSRASQNGNRKLRDLARALVDSEVSPPT
jgi:GAF domain-containing protein